MDGYPQRAPDPTYRSVLVPLDGSKLAMGVLPTARALASRFAATVHTIGVAGSAAEVGELQEHAARTLGTEPGDERVLVKTDHDVVGAIHRRVDELGPCLVCMSSHGRGRIAGSFIGSVARAVVERGGEPAVLVGPLASQGGWKGDRRAPPLGIGALVACVDGTPRSDRVLPVAAAWAHALDMYLTIVTVAEPCPPPLRIGEPWRRHHGPDADADEFVGDLRERWAHASPGVDALVVYDPVSAGEGMRRFLGSHAADLVALACRPRVGIEPVVVGSTAAHIVRTSTVPVLIVPTRQR